MGNVSGRPPAGAKDQPPDSEQAEGATAMIVGVRYVLPAVVTIGGVVVMALGGENNLEGGAGIISAGLAIYLVNWLFRTGAAGDQEREREDAAREYFDLHGRWPD
jgi:hypothetical protein